MLTYCGILNLIVKRKQINELPLIELQALDGIVLTIPDIVHSNSITF